MTRHTTKVTTDHEEIRRWVEERGGWPARVKSTGDDEDPGLIRIDFPGYTGEDTLEPISWDEWFRKFDEKQLAFVYQDRTASGETSFFNKLVSRESAEAREHGTAREGTRASTRPTGRATGATGSRAKTSTTKRATKKSSTSTKSSAKPTRAPMHGAPARSRRHEEE